MDLIQYLEMTYNDCTNPCYFLDYETEELVFLNQSIEKKFQIFENYVGKKAEVIFKDFIDVQDFCPKNVVKEGKYVEKRIFSKALDTFLRANTTLLDICGHKLIMTKYFLTALDQKRAEAEHSFEAAMTQCLEILSLPDQNASIQAFLKLLCEFYSCELAYICEFDCEHNTLASKYFWNSINGETNTPLERTNTVSMDHFVQWLQNDKNKEIVSLDAKTKKYENDTTESELLDKYNISNLTLNKLWNKDGSLLGIVGMSNCSEVIYDERLLKAVSHFVVERFNEASMVRALESLNELDLLTGFFNRNKYARRLSELHENPPKSLGVLFININGLRKTNEYFGFEVGDMQIKKTATLLREFFEDDFYRISGDEFVGFMPDYEKVEFEEKVDQLHLQLKTEKVEATFSLGHSWESGSYNVSNLVKVADTVMVINKQAFYFHSLKDSEEIANTILQDLFRGIAEDEFLVYLQPQINLKTEEVVGAEALIRRFDKKHQKMVFPDIFIPLYEKNSIIRHVDLFVIRKVCQILLEWKHFEKSYLYQ